MPRFVLGYLAWEGRLRTGEEVDANSRTSQNSVPANFGEYPFHALRWIRARVR
jgi:hypothetical protein